METMRYKDKKELVDKLAEYFYKYKGPYYYAKANQFSESEELCMFYEAWIHENGSFNKVLEMLELFESGNPEEASKVFNKFTGRINTESISSFYRLIKGRYL